MKPQREHATNNGQTYMVTSSTWERRALFHTEPWARLLIDRLYHYRGNVYLLHEFVIMPDHFHALITSQTSLEKAVQFIKGGFSYRAKKELGSNMEVWQKGFQDHRIRNANDWAVHVSYIHNNPVKEHFCERPDEFPYSSAHAGTELDAVPQGLKPQLLDQTVAARLEGVPCQNKTSSRNQTFDGATGVAPLQGKISNGTAEPAPLQTKAQTA
jgi:putative transposase